MMMPCGLIACMVLFSYIYLHRYQKSIVKNKSQFTIIVMKLRSLSILLFFAVAIMAFGQAKKPKLMVVPSDAWCKEHGKRSMTRAQWCKCPIIVGPCSRVKTLTTW